MSRPPDGFRFVGRILDRREVIDIHVGRNNDDAARMLTGRPLDALAAGGQTLTLGTGHALDAFFFAITADVAERRFLCDCGDRAGTEDVILTEDLAGKQMGGRLIVAREVQVDIRDFVAVETEEGLKRNVLSVADHLLTAFRTVLIRQVIAGGIFVGIRPFQMVTVRTDIMRRHRVDFRDTGHRRDERRADRTTGTDQIAVLIGFLYQQMGNIVNDRVAVADDRVELTLDACLELFRQRVAVALLCGIVYDFGQILDTAFDDRGIQLVMDRIDLLTERGDLRRIPDDHLVDQVFVFQPHKGITHLIGIEETLFRGDLLCSSLLVEDEQRMMDAADAERIDIDVAKDLFVFADIVQVSGRDDRFTLLLCLGDDILLELTDVIPGIAVTVDDQVAVIVERL